MTLSEYLENPMGKGDSSLPNRALVLQTLNAKYDSLVRRKHDKIQIIVYNNAFKREFYYHLIIPSETDRDNSYDVVFKFNDDGSHNKDLSIRNFEVQMFANSPSFAYTFAYVYRQYGLMIPLLEPKLGKEPLTQAPTIRNRFEVVNYDKYLYFGAKYLIDSKLYLNRGYIDTHAKRYSEPAILKNVRSLKTIMKEYDEARSKLRTEKNRSKHPNMNPKRTLDGDVGIHGPVSATTASVIRKKKPKPKVTPKKSTGNRLRKK